MNKQIAGYSLRKLVCMAEIMHAHPEYSDIGTLVETGTFRADFITRARSLFDRVHTIERDPKLYAQAVRQYGCCRIVFHGGDSREVLPNLTRELTHPAVWFLDAHFCPNERTPTAGQGDIPLFDELRIIAARPCQDIIVVDDVHAFGRSYENERDQWLNVSPETITAALGRVRDSRVVGDMMFAAWRNAA